jgi:hypothetical protein
LLGSAAGTDLRRVLEGMLFAVLAIGFWRELVIVFPVWVIVLPAALLAHYFLMFSAVSHSFDEVNGV